MPGVTLDPVPKFDEQPPIEACEKPPNVEQSPTADVAEASEPSAEDLIGFVQRGDMTLRILRGGAA